MPFRTTNFFIKWGMKGNSASPEHLDEYKADMRTQTLSCLKNIQQENALFRISGDLCRVENPLLITVAEKEMNFVYESAKDLNNCLSNSQAYMVPNVVHNWALGAPELFNRVARAWINDKQVLESLSKL